MSPTRKNAWDFFVVMSWNKMADFSNEEIVPREPSLAVFSRADFMKESFSVDSFVGSCKGSVPLDALKANLDDYLKSLKHALIELINEDYADFVNLSTNLVGMDKNIASLSVPLGQLKEEVLLIKCDLDGTIGAIENKLDERAFLRQKKMCMQHLLNITKSLEKIERLLQGSKITQDVSSKDPDSDDDSQLIERVASEFNQLQFYVTQSQGHPLVESIRGRIAAITSTLQKKLEAAFQEGLQTGELNLLSRVLRTYAIIDKTRDAEMLFREVTVKPYMSEVIDEKMLTADPSNGLYNVYNRVLEFVPRHCTQMINITSGRFVASDAEMFGEQRAGIRGFDFIVNAVWPEVISLIEARLGSIFAPGNPDSFHQKYMTTVWFINKFEGICGSKASVQRLRSHPSFTAFLARWSLPVYFQIRFQEMASKFETALQSSQEIAQQDSELFLTSAVSVLWWCIQRCWQDSVYIQALCHRFWKLTLQMLSRLFVWIRDDVSCKRPTIVSEGENSANQGTEETATFYLVHLLSDLNTLLTKVPEFFRQDILPKLRQTNIQDTELLTEAILESCGALQQLVPGLEGQIVSQVVNRASHGLEAAKNIPRLYRRTNKDAPSKASPFVSSVLKPVREFLEQHHTLVSQQQRQAWAAAILQALLLKYHAVTGDVLTSIKRTEDSLMRLKRSRKQQGSGTGGQSANQENQTAISDDDKIRLQFTLDTEEFGRAIKELGVEENRTPAYTELLNTVKAARASNPGTN